MSKQDRIVNFVVNEGEMSGTSVDIFSTPEIDNTTFSGNEVEIRLLTVLDRVLII